MNAILMFAVLAFVATGCCALVLRKVAFPKAHAPITAAWVDELSVDRYRPMLRLLDGGDFEFLCALTGRDPKRLDNLRRERVRIFRGYLRDLNTDFACVTMAIKMIMLQSEIDRPDLASTLLRSQVVFGARMLSIHAGLVSYQLGLGRVEIGGLLNLFDSMRQELRSLAPAAAALGA